MCVLDLTLFLTSSFPEHGLSFPKPQCDEQIIFCFLLLYVSLQIALFYFYFHL